MFTNKRCAAFTLIETLVATAVAILIIVAFFNIGGCSRSDGSRVGVVTKFSYKGIVLKSYEGELAMSGLREKFTRDGAASVNNVWEFSVLDKSVAQKIQSLQDNGHRAKLKYHQTLLHSPMARDTSYIIVEAIDLDAPESR